MSDPAVDHDWFLPILSLAIPIVCLGLVAFSIWRGEIDVRGGAVYRRDDNPTMFWVCAGTFLVLGSVILFADIYNLISK